MKTTILLLLACLAPLQAEPPHIDQIKIDSGTLTLKNIGIVFQSKEKTTVYGFSESEPSRAVFVPGYQVVRVSTESERKDNPDSGKVTLRGTNGRDTIELFYEKSVPVLRINIEYKGHDGHTLWKLLEQTHALNQ